MKFLIGLIIATLAINSAFAQEPRSLICLPKIPERSEVFEIRILNHKADDRVEWRVISPPEEMAKVYTVGTSLLIDPHMDYLGKVAVACAVSNSKKDELEILYLETIIRNGGVELTPLGDGGISSPSVSIPNKTSDVPVQPVQEDPAHDVQPVQPVQESVQEPEQEPEQAKYYKEPTAFTVSLKYAPNWNPVVYGIWSDAAQKLESGADIRSVDIAMVRKLNKSNLTGWASHWNAAMAYVDNKPDQDMAKIYSEIAKGIKGKKDD